jgi:DnaJ-class molecular chaperone
LDLFIEVPLTFFQAVYGFTITIPLLNGKLLKVQSSTSTSSHSVECFHNEGLSAINSNEKGKLYVIYTIALPELKVVPESKPFFHSLDPTALEKEKLDIINPIPVSKSTYTDPILINSLYYQLRQQEKQKMDHNENQNQYHESSQQPQCAQQ